MLAVSRQTYEEGRRVFYGLNMFVFENLCAIPVFLIGIGRHNAMFLRSVKWGKEWGKWQEWIEVLQPFLVPVVVEEEKEEEGCGNDDYDYDEEVGEGDEEENDEEEDENNHEEDTTPQEPTIWTDEDTYLKFLKLLAAKPPTAMYNSDRDRLLRFEDAGEFVSGDIRERHIMNVTLKRDTNAGSIMKKGVVSFELLERKSKENRLPWSVKSSYEYYQARQKGEYLATNSNRPKVDKI